MYGQKTFRKRPLFHAPSFSSEGGSVHTERTHSPRRTSTGSKRSAALSRKSGVSEVVEGLQHDTKWMKPREYLLVVIEAALSLTAFVVRERYSCLASMVIGVLADSFLRYHTVAMFSVILHFAAGCLVFMEDTIRGTQRGNPYAQLMWNVCLYSLVLIKASDFTRLVYGLEGMTNRRRSTICIFVFLMFWVSSYASYGGIIRNFVGSFYRHIQFRLSILSFVLTGVSLYLFVYVLKPETPKKENIGVGCKVVGCLFLASYYKIFGVKKVKKKRGFFSSTEGNYEKTIISRTRELVLLYGLLLPTLGIVFYSTMSSSLFFTTISNRIKTTDALTKVVGLSELARVVSSVTMLLSYFGLWPLLTLIGVKNRATIKFLFGHMVAVAVLFYSGILMRTVESPQFTSSSGFVRVFNARTEPVKFLSEDRDFTTHEFEVDPKTGILLAYPCYRESLFSMRAVFNGTMMNFTTFLSVAPDETTGYIVLDPPEIARIRGPYLPLRQGPPGTNIGSWPRVYIYNTVKTLVGAKVKIKPLNQKKPSRKVLVQAGLMTTIALEPATYDFSISLTEIKKVVQIEEGGVYGVLFHATTTSREMEIDPVVPPNSVSPGIYYGLYILRGFAEGICYPTMRAIIFFIAPHGLPAMAFAFLAFLEGISLWIGYIGFITWHYYITATAMFGYAFGVTLFFFVCMFFLLKFKDSYS